MSFSKQLNYTIDPLNPPNFQIVKEILTYNDHISLFKKNHLYKTPDYGVTFEHDVYRVRINTEKLTEKDFELLEDIVHSKQIARSKQFTNELTKNSLYPVFDNLSQCVHACELYQDLYIPQCKTIELERLTVSDKEMLQEIINCHQNNKILKKGYTYLVQLGDTILAYRLSHHCLIRNSKKNNEIRVEVISNLELGHGVYGAVHRISTTLKAASRSNGFFTQKTNLQQQRNVKERIVKIIKFRPDRNRSQNIQEIKNEFDLTSLIKKMAIKNYIIYKNAGYLIMRFLHGESLTNIIKNRNKLSFYKRLQYAIAILYELHDIHQYLIHKDLKPDNILMDISEDDINVSIYDFGLSKHINEDDIDSKGTPLYMSPEAYFSRKKTTQKTDVFAFAKILGEFFDYDPRSIKTVSELKKELNNGIQFTGLFKNVADKEKKLINKYLLRISECLPRIGNIKVDDRYSVLESISELEDILFQLKGEYIRKFSCFAEETKKTACDTEVIVSAVQAAEKLAKMLDGEKDILFSQEELSAIGQDKLGVIARDCELIGLISIKSLKQALPENNKTSMILHKPTQTIAYR